MSAKKTLFLHIGYPKTGTTSIQNILASNHEVLKQSGVLYPTSGRHNEAHHAIPWLIANDPRYSGMETLEQHISNLKDEVLQSGLNRFIISSEAFVFMKDPKRIKNIFSELFDEIFIIICLRNPIEWIYSDYNQGVKAHRSLTNTFDEFVSTIGQFKKGPLNYIYQVKKWSKAFGGSSVRVVDYAKKPDVFLERAFNALQIRDVLSNHLNKGEILNKSNSLELLEFFRGMNVLGAGFKAKTKVPINEFSETQQTRKPFLSQENKAWLAHQTEELSRRYNLNWNHEMLKDFVVEQDTHENLIIHCKSKLIELSINI